MADAARAICAAAPNVAFIVDAGNDLFPLGRLIACFDCIASVFCQSMLCSVIVGVELNACGCEDQNHS